MDIESRPRISRVRHETRRRSLVVKRRLQLSPGLVRFTLTGDDLAGFTSLGFDDHIKLIFDVPGGEPAMRDYTPRRYDPAANELDVEFALHDPAGPATAWAATADAGSTIQVGGPRGSFVIEDSFDWYVFAGDETALPAIGRRLSELRPGVPAYVFVEVSDAGQEIAPTSKAAVTLVWVHRAVGETLAGAIKAANLPKGDGYVWVAAEEATAKSLRRLFVEELAHSPDAIRAASYWRRGDSNVHKVLDGS